MTLCRNGCGKELTWDKERKSDGGTMIPIERATNEPHDCPKSDYNQKKQGSGETTEKPAQIQQTITGDAPTLSLAERIGILESAVASMQSRLSKLDPVV